MLIRARFHQIAGRTHQRQDYDERSTHDQHENHIDISARTLVGPPRRGRTISFARSARNSLLWSRLRISREAS